MAILKYALYLFFWPGDFISRKMGASPQDEDGVVLRSFINMVFWGAVFLVIASPLFTR